MRIKKGLTLWLLIVFLFTSLYVQPKQKAYAVYPLVVGAGSFLLEAGVSAGMSYLLTRIGKTAGSSALQEDYDTYSQQVWSRMSAQERADVKWAMDNPTPNPKKPGFGKIALAGSLIATILGIAGDVDKSIGTPNDTLAVEGAKPIGTASNPTKWIGSPFGGTFTPIPNNPKYYYFDAPNLAPIASPSTSLRSNQYFPNSSPAITETRAYMYSATIVAITFIMTDANTRTQYYQATDALIGLLTGAVEYATKSTVPAGTISQQPYTVPAPSDTVEVEVPTKDNPMTRAQTFTEVKNNPDIATPKPEDYAEPNAEPDTKPVEADWWKWLTAPIEKILELLKQLYEFLKSLGLTLWEWLSSIVSKLADLIASIGNWFGQLFQKLGDWFATLWDWLKKIFDKIGELLASLGQWFADLLASLGNWLSPLGEWFKNLGLDILSLPQTVFDIFMVNIIGNPQEIEWDKLKQTGTFFTTKFPFSLPWDIQNSLEAVFSGVSTDLPSWDYPIAGEIIHIEIPAMFRSWGVYIRGFMLIAFDIGLIYAVRKLLGGAS